MASLGRIGIHAFVFFILALVLSFAQAQAQTSTKKSPTKVKIALNWKAEPQFGGFYSAQIGGHYKKNNLDAEVIEGGAGTPVVQMVAAGKFDFGIVSADEAVISRSRGGDVVALFATYQTNPQGIMAHEERGFKNLDDVFNSPGVLAIQKGLPYALFLNKKYKNAKVEIVPYQGGIANYLNDPKYSQQCFITSEPLAANKKGAKTKTFLVSEAGYNPYTTVLVTRGEVLKKNPQLVKSVVAAVRAGWREYLDKPDATNLAMAKINRSMDAATFKESADAQKPLIENDETKKIGLGGMTEERWRTLSQQLMDLKVINKAPEASSLFVNL